MTESAPVVRMTPDEFLAWERLQLERHVYFHGEVFVAQGGSPRHARLGSVVNALLYRALSGKPCATYSADLRIGLDDAHFVYADAVVVCGAPVFRPGTADVVVNPSTVVEVLWKGTEAYDRGAKQAGYLALPSLDHFVLVSQRAHRIETYTRDADGGYHYRVNGPGDTVRLARLAIDLAVNELYAGAFELPGEE